MIFAISIAIAAFLCGAVTALFVMLVIGIRADDRAQRLTRPPRAELEALTRRTLGVGVRRDDPPGWDKDMKDYPEMRSPVTPGHSHHDPLQPFTPSAEKS
jgi:hypothetical protein